MGMTNLELDAVHNLTEESNLANFLFFFFTLVVWVVIRHLFKMQ